MNNFGVFFHVCKCVMYFKLRIFMCFFNYKHFLVRNILGFLMREDLERSRSRMGEYRPLLPSSWGAGLRGFRRLWGLSRGPLSQSPWTPGEAIRTRGQGRPGAPRACSRQLSLTP